MKTKAAILWERNTPWSVEKIELDPPKAGEVLVKIVASGMCHSDEHLVHRRSRWRHARAAADRWPRGRRRRAGGRSRRVQPGARRSRRVRLRAGVRPLPELRRRSQQPVRPRRHHRHAACSSPTARRDTTRRRQGPRTSASARSARSPITPSCNEASCIKIDKDLPARQGLPARLRRRHRLGLGGLRRAGATRRHGRRRRRRRHRRQRHPGCALAGARVIAAIDPIEFKREKAMEFGATHTLASIDEAHRARWPTPRGTVASTR